MALFPGGATALAALGLNLAGDALNNWLSVRVGRSQDVAWPGLFVALDPHPAHTGLLSWRSSTEELAAMTPRPEINPADLPWRVGVTCPVARPRGRLWPRRARSHDRVRERGGSGCRGESL